ncbi:MAG: glycosyltransferase, partial [Caldilinea sp.]
LGQAGGIQRLFGLRAEGVAAEHGVNLLLADDPSAFARAVIDLFVESTLNQRIATGGRSTVLERYNWRAIYRDWERIYQRRS